MSRQSTLDEYGGDGVGGGRDMDVIETEPDMPSPARVRWIDAFNKVCAQLNDVSSDRNLFVLYQHYTHNTHTHTHLK